METKEAEHRLIQAKATLNKFLTDKGDFSEHGLSFRGIGVYSLVHLAMVHFRTREIQERGQALSEWAAAQLETPVIYFGSDKDEVGKLKSKREALIDALPEKLDRVVNETAQAIKEIDKDLSGFAGSAAKEYLATRRALEREIKELEDYILQCKTEAVMSQIKPVLNNHTVTWHTSRKTIPKKSGVYIICLGDEILYVGESEKIRQRLAPSHHIYEAEKHLVGVILVENRKQLEALLIKALYPRLNVKGTISEYQTSLLGDT